MIMLGTKPACNTLFSKFFVNKDTPKYIFKSPALKDIKIFSSPFPLILDVKPQSKRFSNHRLAA